VLARFNGADEDSAVDLTVEDVRTAGFKPRRGGYAEEAVDEMLDRVVELLLVQRRESNSSRAGRSQEPDVGSRGPGL
jgi:DivIVA domain-containing protein